jgi:UPF0755 protein
MIIRLGFMQSYYFILAFRSSISRILQACAACEALIEEKFFKITAAEFLQWTKRYEGKLFPDTYLWPVNETASEAVTAMKLNFDKQTKDVSAKTVLAKKDFTDILKMASIIELEANNDIDRHIISGIFWRRLSIGMPLQANSTLKYADANKI